VRHDSGDPQRDQKRGGQDRPAKIHYPGGGDEEKKNGMEKQTERTLKGRPRGGTSQPSSFQRHEDGWDSSEKENRKKLKNIQKRIAGKGGKE